MAAKDDATAELDWGQAEVSAGTLTLPLTQKASKRWVNEVVAVLERLAPDAGAEVGREQLTLPVAMGGEGDARHLLESAVLEANSRLAPADDGDGGDEPDADDAAMTETFRSFAPYDA